MQSTSAMPSGTGSLAIASQQRPATHLPKRPASRSSNLTALSVSQLTTYRWSFDEDVAGFDRAGIRRLAVWRRKLDDFGTERAIELLHDYRMGVSSLNWAGGFTGGNGFTFVDAVQDIRQAIREAAAVGARTLTIVSGPRAGHIITHARRLLKEGLSATVDIAAEHGVTLALQPMAPIYARDWTFLDTMDATLDLLSEFDHRFLGMAFGTYHLWQESRLLERLPDAVPFLASVQLSDWRPPRHETDRYLPGEGVIPLRQIIAALTEAGYRGDYEIDVWSSNIWKSDYTALLTRTKGVCSDLLALAPAVAT